MSPRNIDKKDFLERENELIDAALRIIGEQGVAALTIDKLVTQVPYSKGTIYNHFCGKEDLLAAVCNSGLKALADLFERATHFSGSTRERMLAQGQAYLVYSQLKPVQFLLAVSTITPVFGEKLSEKRIEEYQQLETKLLSPIVSIVDEAFAQQELINPNNLDSEQIAFTIWAMGFGTIALLTGEIAHCEYRAKKALQDQLLNNANIVLDGLGWHPFSKDYNYQHSIERINREIFNSELRQLKALAVT
ncbi:MAG: TetR/AcrR family transcriptional regulator [Chromatiales bacterium]|nr:TetR/AcrR family transcriptional regulator [Chromatiales bacterium]